MKKLSIALTIACLIIFQNNGWAQQESQNSASKNQSINVFLTESIQWKDGPPSLPAGAKFAVLEGDPGKAGPFTIRIKVPAGYQIPAHRHPDQERVTVISGQIKLGHGDKIDPSVTTLLSSGAFALIPKDHHHFAIVEQDAEIQLHGTGPWDILYLDPQHDPRKVNVKK